jgi:ATP-dependent helicase/nuclease subunit B
MHNPWDLEEPVRGTLASFVQEEMTLRGETDEMDQTLSTIPVHFEEFLSESIGGVDVHGFVDRVDVEEETGEFVVRDYKTGSVPSGKEVFGGLDFQIPIYMRLADLAYEDKEAIAGTYYSVGGPGSVSSYGTVLAADEDAVWNKTGGGPVRRHNTPSLNEREELHRFIREVVPDRVEKMRSSIASGYFHPTVNEPDDAGCSYCDFREVCDVREHRRHEMMSSLAGRDDDVYVPQKTLEDSPEVETESNGGINMNGGES